MARRRILRLVVLTSGGLACAQASRQMPLNPPPRSLTVDEEAAVIAVAVRLFDSATAKVPVCVSLRDARESYDVGPRVLRALSPRARQMKDCPPTYESMILTPNMPRRPPGYIDPYQLELRWPLSTDTAITVSAQLWQGTGFTAYRCEVRKEAVGRPAMCVVTGRGFS